MRTPNKNRIKRRRYAPNRIKTGISYDVAEVAKLLGVHRNTVRQWLREGLKTIDDRRPLLIHGAALKAFLEERQRARKQVCGLGEFFCFKCRAPRAPYGGMADVAEHTTKIAKLTAICSVCETEMHRTIRRADLGKLALVLNLKSMASERLKDRPEANANCDSERDRVHAETEPAE
jgi:excisionase family DNA binding protein